MVANLTTRLGQLTSSPAGGPYTGANKIINGDMAIDQRNAGASVTPTATAYTLDRWNIAVAVASKFSVQQNAGSVTPPAGFTSYLGITSLSSYSVGAAEYFALRQIIEGNNCSDMNWGTANAKTITMSFWVRSSLTGTFGGSIYNSAANRSYPYTYAISAANTWEQKTVTIAGDTSGTWLTTNGVGMNVFWGLGMGSTLSGTAGAWAGAQYISATGAVSVVGTNNATWYITGVKLEVGSIATPFVPDDYQVSLAKCQRYYQYLNSSTGAYSIIGVVGQTNNIFTVWLPVVMRTSPTAVFTNSSSPLYYLNTIGGSQTSATPTSATLAFQTTGGRFYTALYGASGTACWFDLGGGNALMTLSAEL